MAQRARFSTSCWARCSSSISYCRPHWLLRNRPTATSSDGHGAVSGLEIDAFGSGEKRGLTARVGGGGEKHAGYFSASSGVDHEFTQALHANASSEGSGPLMGLWSGLTGSGTGWKQGIISEVSGAGPKQTGMFHATSPSGSSDATHGLNLYAVSDGTGPTRGLWLDTHGSGSGLKEGISSNVYGAGEKFGARVFVSSEAGSADFSAGLQAWVNHEGMGEARGLLISVQGAGAGPKRERGTTPATTRRSPGGATAATGSEPARARRTFGNG